MAALAVGVMWFTRPVETLFRITAQTEVVSFTKVPAVPMRPVPLRSAWVYFSDGQRRHDGSLELGDSVDVTLTRISSDTLRMVLDPLGHSGATARLLARNGAAVAKLDGNVRIMIPIPASGNRVIRFAAAEAGVGSVDDPTDSPGAALMRSGRVALLGTSRSGQAFEARSYEIVPGERVEKDSSQVGDTVPWSGLVIADERPGLTVTLATRGDHILLMRGDTRPYRLSVSYLDQLGGDPSLGAMLLVVAFSFQIAVGLLTNFIQRKIEQRKET